jgi:hypothetical protein
VSTRKRLAALLVAALAALAGIIAPAAAASADESGVEVTLRGPLACC